MIVVRLMTIIVALGRLYIFMSVYRLRCTARYFVKFVSQNVHEICLTNDRKLE